MEDAATMTSTRSSKIKNLLRSSDSFFDVVGLRPVGIVVFATSTILFFYLIGLSAGTIHADGVAVAGRVDHPAPVSSFVTRVFVKRGDRVEVGMPLVELSPDEIDQDLARTDFEIGQLTRALGLANTRPSDTVAPGDPQHWIGLEARAEMLRIKRARLLEDRAALTVTSSFAGIISEVSWLGASIPKRASVASVMPEFAEEIIAYVGDRKWRRGLHDERPNGCVSRSGESSDPRRRGQRGPRPASTVFGERRPWYASSYYSSSRLPAREWSGGRAELP
jgi:hypothetical protein